MAKGKASMMVEKDAFNAGAAQPRQVPLHREVLSRPKRLRAWHAYLQAAPLALLLLVFLAVPIGVIVVYSFWRFTGFQTLPDFTFDNYMQLLTSSITYLSYLTAIKLTLITWVITLLVG